MSSVAHSVPTLLLVLVVAFSLTPMQASAVTPKSTAPLLPETTHTSAPTTQAAEPAEEAALAPSGVSYKSLHLRGDNWVEIPYHAALQPQSAFTIEAWVRRTSERCETIVGQDFMISYWLGFCNGPVRVYTGGPAPTYMEGQTTVPANVWTHVAFTWVSGKGAVIYINGEWDAAPKLLSPPAGSAPLRIGADWSGPYAFTGDIAEVRLWNRARGQDEIRRDMHVQLNEPLPGLVANWHLTGDLLDAIGGFNGVMHGAQDFTGADSPARPARPLIEPQFGRLPGTMLGAAVAGLGANTAAIYAGDGNPALEGRIYRLDMAAGTTTLVGTTASSRAYAGAAYAPTTRSAFFFGGRDLAGMVFSPGVVWVRSDGIGSASQMPTSMEPGPVVYHPGLRKILLFGGWSGGNNYPHAILAFDPQSGGYSTLPLQLPVGMVAVPGVYSSATGKVYLFGAVNQSGLDRTIYEVTLAADGSGGQVIATGTTLPAGYAARAAAAEDPTTGLITIASNSMLLVFDPVTRELWTLPTPVPFTGSGGMVYHGAARSLLLVGGTLGGAPLNTIVRVRQGNGPRLPQGRWDFPAPVNAPITAIEGAGPRVVVGTNGAGLYAYNSDNSRDQWDANDLGANTITDVRYRAPENHIWAATDAGARRIEPGSITTYQHTTPDIRAIELEPTYSNPDVAPFLGTGASGIQWRDYRPHPLTPPITWRTNFTGRRIQALSHLAQGDLWGASGNVVLNLQYTRQPNGSPTTEVNRGALCPQLWNVADLAFDATGDLWLVSPDEPVSAAQRPAAAAVFGQGVCLVRDPETVSPPANYWATTPVGAKAGKVAVDSDGRAWVGVMAQTDESGGLAIFENLPDGLDAGGINWLNGPVGGRTLVYNPNPQITNDQWASSVNALGAVDERIWTGNDAGRLVTYAPRWNQPVWAQGVQDWQFTRIWTVRGRLFAAGQNGDAQALWVLAPDGRTWTRTDLPGNPVTAVLGDRQGRIWVGTALGLYLYTPGGVLQPPSGFAGVPPDGVTALVEDHSERIWIGSKTGLTLFDRGRFVATFTAANSELLSEHISALWADPWGDLWIGTTSGLARLREEQFTDVGSAMGLPSGTIYAIARARDGMLAVSLDAGIALTDTANQFHMAEEPYLQQPLPLTVDEGGNLWAGGALRRSGVWQRYYTTNSGLRHSTVADVAADQAGSLWFAHFPAAGLSVRSSYLPPLGVTLPTISGVDPRQGGLGTEVTIAGTGFSANRADLEVSIGGTAVEIVNATPTRIVVRVGREVVSGDVAVRARGQAVVFGSTGSGDTLQRAFCTRPSYDRFTPMGGNYGVPVLIQGANFDPGAMWLQVGSGAWRLADASTATELRTIIQPTDTTPAGEEEINLERRLTGCSATVPLWLSGFRVYNLAIAETWAYQGLASTPLIADRPTLIAAYPMVASGPIMRPEDRAEVDALVITLRDPAHPTVTSSQEIRLFRSLPLTPGALDPLIREDLTTWITVSNFLPTLPGWTQGDLEVGVTLKRSGSVLAQDTQTFTFNRNAHLPVLFVPIVPHVWTEAHLYELQERVYSGYEDFHKRMLPNGDLDPSWSPTVISLEEGEKLSLGEVLDLYTYGRHMDRIRTFVSERDHVGQDPIVAFGTVISDSVSSDSAQGFAFWGDTSALINSMGLSAAAGVCDVLLAPLNYLDLGTEEVCDFEIPMYVGWGQANWNIPTTLVHELGHILGLVSPSAPNSDEIANISHSWYDELNRTYDGQNNGTCNNSSDYDTGRVLYRSPGVYDPVLNPITGRQYYPELGSSVGGQRKNYPRGKAMMSYACECKARNTFFEPTDVEAAQAVYGMMGLPPLSMSATSAEAEASSTASQRPDASAPAAARTVAGQRIHVTGEVSKTLAAGRILSLDALGDQSRISPSWATGYWLIQRGADGSELARTGVYPQFNVTAEGGPVKHVETGFFAATIVKAAGLHSLELRKGTTLLEERHASGGAPAVTVSSPSGGSYTGATIPLAWNAADPDGNTLDVTFYYSRDGGLTWRFAGMAANTGSYALPSLMLGGSKTARLMVVASDGFNQGRGVSAQFSVPNRAPVPFITAPQAGDTAMEGQPVWLTGLALDRQDDGIEGNTDRLRWSSDRDGILGTGGKISVLLSVGRHTITLEVVNSAGLTASKTATITVLGDYDYDGLADGAELGSGLNPLRAADVASDNDKDGLRWLVEYRRGTNPGNPDSDGDNYNDREEVIAGTDPLNKSDNPATRPADRLRVGPDAIDIERDLSFDVPPPQQPLSVMSDRTAAWTLKSDVTWLGATNAAGETPGSTTVNVAVWKLVDGEHHATLTFESPSLPPVTVPITVTITNRIGWCDADLNGQTNQADLALVNALVGTNSTQPEYRYRADLDRSGKIDPGDVSLAEQCIDEGEKVYLPVVLRP